MKYCTPDYYDRFKCSASECTDTCCRFWQVELDSASFDRYTGMRKDAVISRRISAAIRGNRRRAIFKNRANGDCAFLNSCLLCDIHTDLGHEALPETCRLYPRFFNTFGGYEERGLSYSCPAAARLIAACESNIIYCEDDSPISNYTEIDAELFLAVRGARDRLLEFIDKFDGEPGILVNSVLDFGRSVQTFIEQKRCSDIKDISVNISPERPSCLDNNKLRILVINDHIKHRHLRDTWKDELRSASISPFKAEKTILKNWLSYFIFRYLLKSSKDGRFFDKIKAAVISYLVIGSLQMDSVDAMQKYSKETEHNEYNIKRLFKLAAKTKLC